MDPLATASTSSAWTPTARLRALAAAHHAVQPAVGVERAIHYTEFFKRQRRTNEDAHLRNARALADHLARRSIRIYDDELIVGSHTEHRVGAICQIERAGLVMLEDLFCFETRPTNPLAIDPKARRTLLTRVIPYWLTRGIPARAFPFVQGLRFSAEQLKGTWFIINEAGGIAHFLPDYESIIKLGTEGLRERVQMRLKLDDLREEQRQYLDASLVALEAIELFADRYCAEAKRLGRTDLVTLLEASPRKPARSIREALQTIWFFQMIIQMESLDQGISLGRMDQYLAPLYAEETARSDFNPDQLRELIGAFALKLSEVIPLFSRRITRFFAGLPTGQALTIGGLNVEGRDASNPLTFAFLDVMQAFKTRQPNWHARLSQHSNPRYLQRVVEVVAQGGGSPALYNDDVIMPAMARRCPDRDQVWNYATVGCVEPALQQQSFTSSDAAIFNLAVNLETALGGGRRLGHWRERLSRGRLGAIDSMEALFAAFEEQTVARLDYLKTCLDAIERVNARDFPTPYSSLSVLGCIDSATDLTSGGAPFNASGIQGVGVADVANSLAAIEQLVFVRGKYTLREVVEACAENFDGWELLLAEARKVPKFGNDEPRVDHWARRVVEMFDRHVSSKRNTRGGTWIPGGYSMTCHQVFGEQTGALPSGRLAGRPLADGLAPADGSDVLGPTASLNSVATIDHERLANGVNLNIKFDAATVAGAQGRAVLEGLVRGYFSQGGMQVQLNVLDATVLQAAREDPDAHRNLLVRVSGYCAYFVDLTPGMQQELIDRSLQRTPT